MLLQTALNGILLMKVWPLDNRKEKKYLCTFGNSAVIAYLNDNFISIKVNYDTEKRLVSMFKVRGLPDNWFFSKDRKDTKHQPGYIPPEKFLVMLKKI